MLVLLRGLSETIILTLEDGRRITVMLVETRGDKARIGVTADKSIGVNRGEVQKAIDAERLNADDPSHPDFGRDRA